MCERSINQLPPASPQLGTRPTAQVCALTGIRTGDPSLHRPALNPLNHTSQEDLIYFKQDECYQWLGKLGSVYVRVPSPALQEDMERET